MTYKLLLNFTTIYNLCYLIQYEYRLKVTNMTGNHYFDGKDPLIDDTSCDYLIIKIFNIKQFKSYCMLLMWY